MAPARPYWKGYLKLSLVSCPICLYSGRSSTERVAFRHGKDMVALGRVVLSKRERVIMLEPSDKGLIGTTLHYPYEVRDAEEYFADIPDLTVEPEMLKLAEHILQSKGTDFDPSRFVDHYEQAVVEMLKKKQAGIVVSRERAVPRLPECPQYH